MLYNIPATSADMQENSGHRASSPSSPVLTGSTGNEPGRRTESHVFILQKLQEGGSGDPSPSQPWDLQRNLTEAQNPSLTALSNSKKADEGPQKRGPGLPGVTVCAAVTSWTGGLKKDPATVPNIHLSLTTSPRSPVDARAPQTQVNCVKECPGESGTSTQVR